MNVKLFEDLLSSPVSHSLVQINEKVHHATFLGVQVRKNPLDFWVYQEILWETQPEYVVEIGTFAGGSALALATFLDAVGKGTVITVDLNHSQVHEKVRQHPRIRLLTGDAVALAETVRNTVGNGSVMVIEDSSHTYENTLNVMRAYCSLVKPAGYLVVEDTVCHHGIDIGPEPGPYEAVQTFVTENPAFECDRSREGFGITWNPKGFLRRKA